MPTDLIAELEKLIAEHRRARPQPQAMTIKDFCEIERMSPSTYYKLQRQRLGPEVTRIPGMTFRRITKAAHARWKKDQARRQREQEATITAEREALVETRRAAGRASAASPKHVSKRKK